MDMSYEVLALRKSGVYGREMTKIWVIYRFDVCYHAFKEIHSIFRNPYFGCTRFVNEPSKYV